MKSRILPTLILVFALYGRNLASDFRLTGCPDPEAIAGALAKLDAIDWHKLSSTQVRSIWPTNLNSISCERDTGCRMFGSKGRIIEGDCECCEMFDFDLKPNPADGDELRNIIIHYSSRDREETISVAKRLAKATGLPDAKLATVGQDSIQRFQWIDGQRRVGQPSDLELQFTHHGTAWQLYFVFAHE